jgi:GTP-binding protein HflX
VRTADMLFTTLDSTTRVMSTGYPARLVFSDTVGFIKKLPHQLVESFKSTLEEVALADLMLHVVDCSDADYHEHYLQTRQVLEEIGAGKVPSLPIYNKVDVVTDFVAPNNNGQQSFLISAITGQGVAALQSELIARLQRHHSAATRSSYPG